MKTRNSYYRSLILLALSCLTMFSQAQDKQVNGIIIDALTEKPMSYVNVAVIGSTYGTVSNQNGEFRLNLEGFAKEDSIAFQYLGYKAIKMPLNLLKDGMRIEMKEEAVKLKVVTILANPTSPKELIKKALERKTENYPLIAQKREVFKRFNNASHINTFDLSLIKSSIPEIDQNLIRELVDSMPRYSRSYEDKLYTLYSIPEDSVKLNNKVVGIKNVVLKEDTGGDLDKIANIFTELFDNKTDDKTFWKYKTGPVSLRDSHVKVSGLEDDSTLTANARIDSLFLKNISTLYFITGERGWNWEFIQKPDRYKYKIEGMAPISGEYAYAISFTGKIRGDYQGMIHISADSYAVLRIEYSIKERKKEKSFKLLGISFGDIDDSGLLLFEKDEFGYFLKYSMHSSASKYGIKRPFELIRKQKRTIFNKKLYEAELDINLHGLSESCSETLVVYREAISEEEFNRIQEKGVKPERITSYSDSLWQGYSIIEPTEAMKEYRAKIN